MPDGSGRGGQIGQNYGGRIQWDGAFSIANVPPGRYILRARSADSETPQFAMQPITLDGSDIDGLAVMLSAGATMTGTVIFTPGQSAVPDATQVRITAPSTDLSAFGPQPNARVDKDGRFTLSGVSAGPHLVRSNGNLRGWTLKSVTVDGRDVTDTPIDVRSGQTLSNVTIVFTDKINEISGTITDDHRRADAGLHGARLPDGPVAVASAGTANRHDASGSNREVPLTRAPARRVLRDDGRSRGAGRMVRTGLSRRAPRRRLASHARGRRREDAGL